MIIVLLLLCSLQLSAHEQAMVCEYPGVVGDNLPQLMQYQVTTAHEQTYHELVGVKRKAESSLMSRLAKKSKHEMSCLLGVKRVACVELGGPRKKQKLTHVGPLPWDSLKQKALQACISIKENKPTSLLKDLENCRELLAVLGALLPGDTVMIPVRVTQRSCKQALNTRGIQYVDRSRTLKKITHLPLVFVSLLHEQEPFDIYLQTHETIPQDLKISLLPEQKSGGQSARSFEQVCKHKINQLHAHMQPMDLDSEDDLEIPDISFVHLSTSLKGARADD